MSTNNSAANTGSIKKVLEVKSVFASSGSASPNGFDAKAQSFLNGTRGLSSVHKSSYGMMTAEVSDKGEGVSLEYTQHGQSGKGNFRLVYDLNVSEYEIDEGTLDSVDGPGRDGMMRVSARSRSKSITWVFVCLQNNPQSKPAVSKPATPKPQPPPAPVPTPAAHKPLPQAAVTPPPTPVVKEEVETSQEGDELVVPIPEVRMIRVDQIRPNPEQPRKRQNKNEMGKLAESMRVNGQNDPITVIRVSGDPKISYELVTGQRRWTAAKTIGMSFLKAVIRSRDEIPNREAQNKACFIADSFHAKYDKLEIALALTQQYNSENLTHEQLSSRCGKSVAWVANHLAINKLDPELKRLLDPTLPRKEQLNFGIARQLARVPHDKQKEIYQEISLLKGIPVKIARTKKLVDEIVKVGHAPKPYAHYRKLETFVPRLIAESSMISDFPKSVIDSFVASRSDGDVVGLYRDIEAVKSNLEAFMQKLRGGMTSVQKEVLSGNSK